MRGGLIDPDSPKPGFLKYHVPCGFDARPTDRWHCINWRVSYLFASSSRRYPVFCGAIGPNNKTRCPWMHAVQLFVSALRHLRHSLQATRSYRQAQARYAQSHQTVWVPARTAHASCFRNRLREASPTASIHPTPATCIGARIIEGSPSANLSTHASSMYLIPDPLPIGQSPRCHWQMRGQKEEVAHPFIGGRNGTARSCLQRFQGRRRRLRNSIKATGTAAPSTLPSWRLRIPCCRAITKGRLAHSGEIDDVLREDPDTPFEVIRPREKRAIWSKVLEAEHPTTGKHVALHCQGRPASFQGEHSQATVNRKLAAHLLEKLRAPRNTGQRGTALRLHSELRSQARPVVKPT